jgi:HAE1 family hydrophobic/amphiphilic exporter-1
MSIYETSVKKPVSTALIFIAVVILGVFSFQRLPIDLFPNIEVNMLMVMTTYQGASASDIETNVTRPLENTLNTVANLKTITSSSKENTSIITLEFEYGEDIDVLTNDVRDKLELVKSYLPDGTSTPLIFKFSTDMIPILYISAQAEESLPGLYKILDDNVANPLARIKGVGTVSISGAPEREIQVYVDPNKLEAHSLTVESISQSIMMENRNTPAGSVDIGSDTYSLRVRGEFVEVNELNRVVVGTRLGKTIFLSDVAMVIDGSQERLEESYTNSRQGALIVIQKQSGANTVRITDAIKEELAVIEQNLPSDVKLEIIIDMSDNISNTIASLEETVIFAFIFVMLVVLFFLGRWRATIIIMVTIPVSLISAFIFLFGTGGSLNIISMSGLIIAIGLVVDDAIVVLENITTHIERGSAPRSAAVLGTNEVALAVMASTLTLVAVFLPFTMIPGLAGEMFKQLGWMVTIMISMSLIAAITLTPMMASRMLRKDLKHGKAFNLLYRPVERGLTGLDRAYGRFVNWGVRHRKTIMASAAFIFILSLAPAVFVGFENMPASDDGTITATIELPVGTRMEITRDLTMEITEKWRADYPEIEIVNFSAGQPSESNAWGTLMSRGTNVSSLNIRLSKKNERERTVFEVTEGMRRDLGNYPEVKKSSVTAGGNSMSGGESTLDIEIYGYDFSETDLVANLLADKMRSSRKFSNVTISREDYQPEYQVDFDREKLALNSLDLATASMFLRNRMSGSITSLFREDGEEYNIRVVYAPEARRSIEDIENILIYNNYGQSVRLRDVGIVVERFSPPTIERKSRQRLITVSGIVTGTTLDKAVAETNRILAGIEMPSDINTVIGGSFEDMQEMFTDLGTLFAIILLLVFVVMASQFESLTYPFVIMFSIPFALSGVILALWATGNTFNTMSFIGIIMLAGIVVKNGIVLIDYINLNRERGMGVIQAVVRGGESRLRPVLMTSITAILGMIPLAVSNGEGAEMWKPMAVSVIGGLTVSTLLTLIVIPTLYTVFAGNGILRKRKNFAKLYGGENTAVRD